jgi:hypothetical protein
MLFSGGGASVGSARIASARSARAMSQTVDQMRAALEAELAQADAIVLPGRRSARDRGAPPGSPDYYVTQRGKRPVAVWLLAGSDNRGRTPSKRQGEMMRRLTDAGWRTIVAYSVNEAVVEVTRC